MYQTLNYALLCLRIKAHDFAKDERGEVNIVAIVVLIGIAVLLAIVFKDAIASLLESILKSVKKSASNAVTTPAPSIDID